MEMDELLLGTKLDINIIDGLSSNYGNTYISQVEDIINGDTIVFPVPFYRNRIVSIPVDTRLRFTFSHNKYGLQSFIGIVTKKVKSNNMLYLHGKMETKLEETQRRKHFRLSCYRLSYTMDVQYRIFDNCEAIEDEIVYHRALVKNISEGGMAIVIDKNLRLGSLIEIIMYINNEFALKTLCRVVRHIHTESTKSKRYEIGVLFEEMSHAERNKIVKYIFEQQRYLLKNTGKDADENTKTSSWNILRLLKKIK